MGQPEVLFAKEISNGKPTEIVCLSHCDGQSIKLTTILDTGADVTVIPTHNWPPDWPLIQEPTSIMEVGGCQQTSISQDLIRCTLSDGGTATIKPYVLNLPVALIG